VTSWISVEYPSCAIYIYIYLYLYLFIYLFIYFYFWNSLFPFVCGFWKYLLAALKRLELEVSCMLIETSSTKREMNRWRQIVVHWLLQTDQTVDTNDIDVHRVMVVTERLATLSGTELVTWTADKYGPPVSYNEVITPANHFELTVDGGGMGRPGWCVVLKALDFVYITSRCRVLTWALPAILASSMNVYENLNESLAGFSSYQFCMSHVIETQSDCISLYILCLFTETSRSIRCELYCMYYTYKLSFAAVCRIIIIIIIKILFSSITALLRRL